MLNSAISMVPFLSVLTVGSLMTNVEPHMLTVINGIGGNCTASGVPNGSHELIDCGDMAICTLIP